MTSTQVIAISATAPRPTPHPERRSASCRRAVRKGELTRVGFAHLALS